MAVLDPFADLPQASHETAYRHVKRMRLAGLQLIRLERKRTPGGSNLLLYFGDGKSKDLVTVIVFAPGQQYSCSIPRGSSVAGDEPVFKDLLTS
jgi:hypothetical protein